MEAGYQGTGVGCLHTDTLVEKEGVGIHGDTPKVGSKLQSPSPSQSPCAGHQLDAERSLGKLGLGLKARVLVSTAGLHTWSLGPTLSPLFLQL